MDCLGCKLAKGEIPTKTVYEDEDVRVFLDIFPVSKGHCVIVPKKHYQSFPEAPTEVLAAMMDAVKKASPAILKATGSDRTILATWGEDLPHIHMHIIPKSKGDGLKFWKQGKYADGEIDKVADKIVSFL
jgi:histidine triad (HIT) family protein